MRRKGKRVTLYTGNGTQSELARRWLSDNKIEFTEVNAEKEGIVISKSRLPFLEVRGRGVSTVSGFGDVQYASALFPTISYDDFVKAREKKAAPEMQKVRKQAVL